MRAVIISRGTLTADDARSPAQADATMTVVEGFSESPLHCEYVARRNPPYYKAVGLGVYLRCCAEHRGPESAKEIPQC
jgi:hypothetical protein